MTNEFTQCILGLQCNDFVMLAADQTNSHGIFIVKTDENKLHDIDDALLMGVVAEAGESMQFTQFITKNLQLYKIRNGYKLNTTAAVHFTRKNLSDSLRDSAPSAVNLLIGGYDDKDGCQLYYLDYLATCLKVPIAAHGFGGLLSLSILDQNYEHDLTEKEAYEVLKLCVHEIQHRLFFSLPNFQVKVVCKSGIHELPAITPSAFL